MATLLENLVVRRNAIGVELAALSATKAGGKPNTSGAPVNIDHVGYRLSLLKELTDINQLIAAAEGPFEYASEGTG